MQALESAQVNDIELPRSGATHMGEGLNKVCDCVERDILTSTADRKGDFRPMLFIMTDGSPSDLMDFEAAVKRVKEMNFAEIIACAAGPKAKQEHLKSFATKTVSLETMDSAGFTSYFQWVSASIAANASGQQNGEAEDITLPPPPDEVQIVL